MAPNSPCELADFYNAAFRAGELDYLIALYEQDAVLAPQPGQLVTGQISIRQRLSG